MAALAAALALGAPAEAARDRPALEPRIPVVVVLRAERAPLSARASVAMLQDAVLRRVSAVEFTLTSRFRAIPGFAGLATPAGLAKLRADPNVVRADRDPGGRADDFESSALIRADVARAAGFSGSGATVAVLDSGVDASHPDLAAAIVAEHCICRQPGGAGCCPGGATEADGPGAAADEDGHGTHVAGIIAGTGAVAPVGIAPAAKLVAIRVLDAEGRFAGASQVIEGLDWILAARPDVQVVNLSLGTDQLFDGECDGSGAAAMAFADVITRLRDRGTVVIVASGNDADPARLSLPACVRDAVAVGAVYDQNLGRFETLGCTDEDALADEVACFSNSGPALDLLAPGAVIQTSAPGAQVGLFAGTSAACPAVAGAAAAIFAAAPSAVPSVVEEALAVTGVPVTDARNGLARPRVDVAAAVEAVLSGQVKAPAGQAQLSRSALSFGKVRVRRSKTLVFWVANTGDGPLTVRGTAKAPFSVRGVPATVQPGKLARLRVTFRPGAPRAFSALLRLTTDDPDRPRLSVRLRGAGRR